MYAQQSAAYLYDSFNILLGAINKAATMVPNFTQVQESCDILQEWQFGKTFHPILKVYRYVHACYNNLCVINCR